MRKVAAFSFALIAALLLTVSLADAVGDGGEVSGAGAVRDVGVQYSWWGECGELHVASDPGTPFVVFNAVGDAVAHGVAEDVITTVVAPNVGFGPDGVIVRVDIGGSVVAVVDPEWEWN